MRKNSLYIMLLISAFILLSCEQQNVSLHTIVHKDGTCTREFNYSNVMSKQMRDSLWGDSIGWSQPIPDCLNIDGYEDSHTDVKEDTVTTIFKHVFDTAEEMSAKSPLQLNGVRLKSNAKLEKHFKWFYTEYVFTETFSCVGDSFKLNALNYADENIVSYWFTGQPNLVEGLSGAEASEKIKEMEPLISKWLNDNLFNIIFDYIVNHYDSIAHPPVSRERFIALHDSLTNYILSKYDNTLDVEPANTMRDFFHSDAYNIFFDENTACGKELEKEYSNCLNILWFSVSYTLSMPGKVIDTGTGVYKNGVIFYPLTGERLIPHDYVITATSRVTNIWAYIVSVLIILLSIGSLLYHKVRKE